MGDPGDKRILAKYKLHLHYGEEGLSERAAARASSSRKRMRIQKMYNEPLIPESVTIDGSPQNDDNQAAVGVESNNPIISESRPVGENLSSYRNHEQINDEIPDETAERSAEVHKTVNLANNEDLLPHVDSNEINDQKDIDMEIELENIEIEEDVKDNTDPMQELIDQMEYMIESIEAENEEEDKRENFLNNPKFYESLQKCVERSPAEVLLMILTFCLHAQLPFTHISTLIRMINALFIEKVLPESKYILDKIFNKMDHCEYHAICPDCEIYVGRLKKAGDSVTCELCTQKMDLSNPSSLNFFLIIDPSQYIADYLQDNDTYYDDVMNGKYGNNNNIKDIFDGQLYKDFLKKLSDNDRKNYVTAIVNTDGAPRFESSTFSIWPIYLQVNEVSPQERIRCAIPTALYFGAKKPEMDTFLDPFVEMMNKKERDGFQVNIKGQTRLIKLYPLIGCADAVARAPMQGMVQFNGHYGCAWCEHEGEHDGSMRYPILNRPKPALRDADSTEVNAELATNLGISVNGVKYASPLIKLKYFDIIRGFVPDYMHFYLIGTASQFTNYYFENLSKENKDILDRIMMSFAVPNQICRLSRPLSQRSHWKAKEWENWVLYYSLPVLQLILTERALTHWALLVDSLHILLSMEIKHEELNQAHEKLVEFVKEAERIFSFLVLTSNVHQLEHVCQSVLDWGPVWAHSNFVFESANAILLRAIHCAKGVNLQIMRYINLGHVVRVLKGRVYPITDSIIKRYCEDVEYSSVQKTFKMSNVRYFGQNKITKTEYLEQFNLSTSKSQVFSKIVKDGTLYSQKENRRSCNAYVQLNNGQFIKCLNFVADTESNKEVTLCNFIRTSDYLYSNNILQVTSISNEVQSVNTADIKRVCIFMTVGKKRYICPVVNNLYY